MQSASLPAARIPRSKASIVVLRLSGSWREVCLKKAGRHDGERIRTAKRGGDFDFGNDETYRHGMQLLMFNCT